MQTSILKQSLKGMESSQLIELISLYNDYVQAYPVEHPDGGYPVSFMEWYDNDYLEMIADLVNEDF